MEEKIVSVIVPVYNVEKYLDKCIESVVNQTYEKLDIVLVDDGSTDMSGSICDSWSKIDKRIKVIHKDNSGLGLARNTGLDNVIGDYILFVDSDDFIAEYTIEKCVNASIEKDADLTYFGMARVDLDGKEISRKIPVDCEFSGAQVLSIFLPRLISGGTKTEQSLNLSMNAVSALYKKSIIDDNKWRFVSERQIISEDYYSLLFLYKNVSKVIVLSETFYFYRISTNSLTTVYREDRLEKNKIFFEKSIQAINELKYPEEIKRRFKTPFINNSIAAMKQLIKSNKDRKEKKNILAKYIDDELVQYALRDLYMDKDSFSRKLFLYFARNKKICLCYILLSLK